MRKQITNIADVEITGYEVVESEAKQAASSTTPATGTTASSSQTPSESGTTFCTSDSSAIRERT